MYFKFLYQLIFWIIFTIAGPFIYILFSKTWTSVGRGFGKYKIEAIDNIWKSLWLSSMVWSCFRNPVGNGKRSILSASGHISNVEIKNNIKIVTMSDGS